MKKNILVFFCSAILILLTTVSCTDKKANNNNDNNDFSLVHWNILENMYKINSFVNEHKLTENELKTNPVFVKMLEATFTPDSYTALTNQNTVILMHPNKSLLGKKLSDVKYASPALRIINNSIKTNSCARGFYMWIDNEEKYMVVCPIIGKTKDGKKLYYSYTMYSRSMPAHYLKTLKEASRSE